MRGRKHGAAVYTLTWYALFATCYRRTCSSRVCKRLCAVAWWSAEINIQRVGCDCPLFRALFHCADNGVGGDLSTWWVEVWNKVQAAFPTLILGRMQHRGACRVLAHHTHTILRSANSKAMELCMWHHSVKYAAGAIVKRCNCISIVLCAI